MEAKFQRLPLWTKTIPVKLMELLPDVTGNGNSKIAAQKLAYRLADEIEGQFQQHTL